MADLKNHGSHEYFFVESVRLFLLNLCEGFLFVEGEWRVIFCVNGVGDFDVPWFFCIFVIIKLSQA